MSPEEFERRWREVKPVLRMYCGKLAGNSDDADDLMQRAAVRAFQGRDQFTPGKGFINWTYQIAKRLWMDELRTRGRRVKMVDSNTWCDPDTNEESGLIPGESRPAPVDSLTEEEVAESLTRVRVVIDALVTGRARTALHQRVLEGAPVRDARDRRALWLLTRRLQREMTKSQLKDALSNLTPGEIRRAYTAIGADH